MHASARQKAGLRRRVHHDMDVYNMYLGECSSYTPRGSAYRDYEKFPYGSLERVNNPQKSYYTMVQGEVNTIHQRSIETGSVANAMRNESRDRERALCKKKTTNL